jgi:hypothetical protein
MPHSKKKEKNEFYYKTKEKMEKEKEIEAIKRQIENLDSEHFNMSSWILTTDNFLKSIWGKDTEKSKQLYAICNTMKASMFGCDDEDILEFRKQWKDLLNGYIFELEILEKPKTFQNSTHGGLHLTVNQNQSQEQKQMIEIKLIIDIIKDELTGKQLNELKSIIQDNKIEKKNEKIAEKLISFGSNVASGILGNILSNPQLLGLL